MFKNLRLFMKKKNGSDDLFDCLNVSISARVVEGGRWWMGGGAATWYCIHTVSIVDKYSEQAPDSQSFQDIQCLQDSPRAAG